VNAQHAVFDDAALDGAFMSRGFLVRPFLDPTEILAMERVYAEMFPETDADFSATILNDSTECRLDASAAIRAIVEAPLRRMFGRHKLAVATFVTKRPRTTKGRLPLHQDWWIVDNRVHRALHVWCPLVDVGPDSGCLRVVPGVHHFLNDPYPIHGKFRTAYHPKLAVLDEQCSIRVSMPAGTALIYDERMLHGSDDNRSDHLRVAFNCIMIPEEALPLVYQWDEQAPDRIEVLEVDEPYLCEFRFGVPLSRPYRRGIRLIETIPAAVSPLNDEGIARLRAIQAGFSVEDREGVSV
jgi:hypothetical protein